MRNGVCPKCGSNEIYMRAENKGGENVNSIPLGGFWSIRYFGLDNYICVECGYVESYISSPNALQAIAGEWQRVGGEKRNNDEV